MVFSKTAFDTNPRKCSLKDVDSYEIYPKITISLIQKELLLKCEKLYPNPIYERYRYIPYRELNISQADIEYYRGRKTYPIMRLLRTPKMNAITETMMANPLGSKSLCLKIFAAQGSTSDPGI